MDEREYDANGLIEPGKHAIRFGYLVIKSEKAIERGGYRNIERAWTWLIEARELMNNKILPRYKVWTDGKIKLFDGDLVNGPMQREVVHVLEQYMNPNPARPVPPSVLSSCSGYLQGYHREYNKRMLAVGFREITDEEIANEGVGGDGGR